MCSLSPMRWISLFKRQTRTVEKVYPLVSLVYTFNCFVRFVIMEILSIKCDLTLFDKVGECDLLEKQLEVFYRINLERSYWNKRLVTFRYSKSCSVIQCLVMFLFLLLTGNSNEIIFVLHISTVTRCFVFGRNVR